MDTEFVNAYIIKQKAWIEDLTAKLIILETKLQLAETKLSKLAEDNSLLNSKVEKQSKKKNEVVENSF